MKCICGGPPDQQIMRNNSHTFYPPFVAKHNSFLPADFMLEKEFHGMIMII
jgi:hypothetical protein